MRRLHSNFFVFHLFFVIVYFLNQIPCFFPFLLFFYPQFFLFLLFFIFSYIFLVWAILVAGVNSNTWGIQTPETLAWLWVQDHGGLEQNFQFYCLCGERPVARSRISAYEIKFTWSLHVKQIYSLSCFRWLKVTNRLPNDIKPTCRPICNLSKIKLRATRMMLQHHRGNIFFFPFLILDCKI
jgi:hypothetical protein